MTHYKESVVLSYFLVKVIEQIKIATEVFHRTGFTDFSSTWNRKNYLHGALYYVVDDIKALRGNSSASERLNAVCGSISSVIYYDDSCLPSTLAWIDLMLQPERISETVMYIIHGDI